MSLDWRRPYHSLDQSGAPETCGAEAERWIEAQAAEAADLYGIGSLSLDRQNMIGGGCVIILYRDTDPIAVATIFRTPMNRSTLVRWLA